MNFKSTLSVAVTLCLAACAESVPNQNASKNQQPKVSKNYHLSPTIVPINKLDEDDYSDVISVYGSSAIILSSANADYDSAVVKRNRSISSRGNNSVIINTSGESELTKRIEYDTATGEVTSYQLYEYDPATNTRTKRARYNAAGIDGVWFNEDDVVQDYTTYNVLMGAEQTLMIRYNAAGVDGIWFNEDDDVETYDAELHAADGTAIGVASHSGPGDDGLWFTQDDIIQTLVEDIIEPDGSEHWVMYTEAGADGDWTTLEDNVVGNFSSTLFNADKLETKHIFYTDPGADLKPFTEDDTFSYYHTYTHNVANLESNNVRYNGPGIDGVWLNADDDIQECEESTFSAENHLMQELDTKVGADNLCFSGDDIVVDYNRYVYDDTGHLTDEYRYNDAGPDGKWFTDDDLLSREYVYTPL